MDASTFRDIAETTSRIVDGAGVLVIVLGLAYGIARWLMACSGARECADPYRRLRHDVGRGILLGLEFMVAGDIIRTVAVEPTLDSVAVLAVIVLIRTFLSTSLEVELEGRWPWQRGGDAPRR